MFGCTGVVVLCAGLGLATIGAAAQPIEPQGLYFHEFTGSFGGTEWATWGGREGERRYEFSDLTSAGTFAGTVSESGEVTFDNGFGDGTLVGDGTGTLHLTLPGGLTFESSIARAPFTDERFPVFFSGAVAGDESLSGSWSARVLAVDPATGATIEESAEIVDVLVVGDGIRLTLADGLSLEAGWVADDQAALRVISPHPRPVRYRTFPGSSTTGTEDVLGDIRVTGENSMTAALFFQTRAPVGSQEQSMMYLEMVRVPSPGGSGLALGVGLCVARRRRRPGAS